MKIERTNNASRNILFGIILKIYQLAIPFIMRTLMIYFMGVQYLGLNSLFASVLQVLNLAELGVGSAMVYSMYQPIADDDSRKICELMQLYKIYYRVIGGVILGVGVLLLPMIDHLIEGDIPSDINIYVLYLMNLFATVLTYWLFAYENSLFQAHQRLDIVSKITLVTDTVKYMIQIAVIILTGNYYVYVLAILFTQIMNNILIAVNARKMFPEYRANGKLPKDEVKIINKRIQDLFTSKIGSVVVGSADTIVISAFLGLTALAVYQNYYYLFTAVAGFVAIIFNSVTAGVGNSIITESEEKIYSDFEAFLLIIMWIAGFCCSCFLSLYQPFMELWVGKDLMVEFNVVICLVVYFFVYELNSLLNFYKDSSGMWHEDRWRPLITAIANLGLNLLLVNYIGLYGIILSTVVTMVMIGMPWLIYNLFHHIFSEKYLAGFLKKIAVYACVTILVNFVTYRIGILYHGSFVRMILFRLVVCIVVGNFICFLSYGRFPEFIRVLDIADRITKGKIFIFRKLIEKRA